MARQQVPPPSLEADSSNSTPAEQERIGVLEGRIERVRGWIPWLGVISALAALFGVVAMWPVSGVLNELGDYLAGTVGLILALIGILLIYLAFLGQLLQIEQQHAELRLTQDDIRLARDQLLAQNRHLRQQREESTFFHLVSLHHQIVNELRFKELRLHTVQGQMELKSSNGEDRVGRVGFEYVHWVLSTYYRHLSERQPDRPATESARAAYDVVYDVYQSALGHYFRNLYHIVKFVDRSDLPEKKQYTNIIRAQLSSFELAVLFYNCLVGVGRRKFLPLAEAYELFENLPEQLILNEAHPAGVGPSAFGRKGDHVAS